MLVETPGGVVYVLQASEDERDFLERERRGAIPISRLRASTKGIGYDDRHDGRHNVCPLSGTGVPRTSDLSVCLCRSSVSVCDRVEISYCMYCRSSAW